MPGLGQELNATVLNMMNMTTMTKKKKMTTGSCGNRVARRVRAGEDDVDDSCVDDGVCFDEDEEEDDDTGNVLSGPIPAHVVQDMMGRQDVQGRVLMTFEHRHGHHPDEDDDCISDEMDDDMPSLLGENDEIIAANKETESFHDERDLSQARAQEAPSGDLFLLWPSQ